MVIGTGSGAGRTFDGAGRELPSDGHARPGRRRPLSPAAISSPSSAMISTRSQADRVLGQLALFQPGPEIPAPTTPRPWPGRIGRCPYTGDSVLEDTKSFSCAIRQRFHARQAQRARLLQRHREALRIISTFSYPYNSQVYYSFNPATPTSPSNQTTLYSKRGGVNRHHRHAARPAAGRAPKLTWGGDYIRREDLPDPDQRPGRLHAAEAGHARRLRPASDPDRRAHRRARRRALRSISRLVSDLYPPGRLCCGRGPHAARLPGLRPAGAQCHRRRFRLFGPTFNLGATFKLTETSELFGGFSQGFALPDVGAFTRRAGLSTAYACPVATPNCLPASRSTVSYASIGPDAQIVNNYEIGVRGAMTASRARLSGLSAPPTRA